MTTSSHHHVGFRFRPTDEELANHYLKNKLHGNDSIVRNVAEVDVCKFEPWELPALSVMKSDDPEWFFFCPLNYKYPNNKKLIKRKTNFGFWKPTGKDRIIKIRGTNKVIGVKKTLVYKSHVPGVKTNWVIHEYHDVTLEDHQRTFALCRLMNKAENNAQEETNNTMMNDEGESSTHMSSNNQNQETTENIVENYIPLSTQQSSTSSSEQNYRSSFEGASFETPEEVDAFVNSMLTDGEFTS